MKIPNTFHGRIYGVFENNKLIEMFFLSDAEQVVYQTC